VISRVGGELNINVMMYLNLIQIAESFGVTEKVVEGWIRDQGLPHTPDRRVLLFDRAQVAQWAATRGLAAKAGFLATESPSLTAALRLAPLLHTGGIWRDVVPADVTDTFVRVACALPGVTPAVGRLLKQRLQSAGGVTYAPVGSGLALPHPSTRITLGRESGTLALLFLRDGISLVEPQVDDVPVTRLFFFIAPTPRAHLDMVGRLSRLLSRAMRRDELTSEASDEEIFQVMEAADAAHPEVRKPAGPGS
jgi:PTS system nitrogen regulatory IIA component